MTKSSLLLWCAIAWAIAVASPIQARAQPPAKDAAVQLQSLLKERRDTLRKLVEFRVAQYKAGTVGVIDAAYAQDRLVDVELELAKNKDERIAIRQRQVDFCRSIEKITQARHDAGTVSTADLLDAKDFRLNAEIQLLREKGGTSPRPTP
jgi:hypothetical protein